MTLSLRHFSSGMKDAMGKTLTLLLLGLFTASCIDGDYDLRKVETDNVTIGDGNSTFEDPLVKVFVSMDDINSSDSTRIDLIFEEAGIWLPDRLPDRDENGYYADVQRLLHDASYVNNEILPALLEQMDSDPAKLDEVATLLEKSYYTHFADLLPEVPQDGYKEAFVESYTQYQALHEKLEAEVRSLAAGYINLPGIGGVQLGLTGNIALNTSCTRATAGR